MYWNPLFSEACAAQAQFNTTLTKAVMCHSALVHSGQYSIIVIISHWNKWHVQHITPSLKALIREGGSTGLHLQWTYTLHMINHHSIIYDSQMNIKMSVYPVWKTWSTVNKYNLFWAQMTVTSDNWSSNSNLSNLGWILQLFPAAYWDARFYEGTVSDSMGSVLTCFKSSTECKM